jgi:hypothetical protein
LEPAVRLIEHNSDNTDLFRYALFQVYSCMGNKPHLANLYDLPRMMHVKKNHISILEIPDTKMTTAMQNFLRNLHANRKQFGSFFEMGWFGKCQFSFEKFEEIRQTKLLRNEWTKLWDSIFRREQNQNIVKDLLASLEKLGLQFGDLNLLCFLELFYRKKEMDIPLLNLITTWCTTLKQTDNIPEFDTLYKNQFENLRKLTDSTQLGALASDCGLILPPPSTVGDGLKGIIESISIQNLHIWANTFHLRQEGIFL